MFYVGSHNGSSDDGYVSSSRWMNYEYKYRPSDFKRKIVKRFDTHHDALLCEYSLITKMGESNFGKKYYNLRIGKPKGIEPWNKGKLSDYSDDTITKMSLAKLGNSNTKGKKFPDQCGNNNVMNRPECKDKLSKISTGRKMATLPDGTRKWTYPNN